MLGRQSTLQMERFLNCICKSVGIFPTANDHFKSVSHLIKVYTSFSFKDIIVLTANLTDYGIEQI